MTRPRDLTDKYSLVPPSPRNLNCLENYYSQKKATCAVQSKQVARESIIKFLIINTSKLM
jgi:hypothetical protein